MSLAVDRITALLHIVEKSRQWPRLQHLHDAAMRELEVHSQDAHGEHEERLTAERKAAERAAALKAASTSVEVPDEPERPDPLPGTNAPRTRLLDPTAESRSE